MAKQRAKSPRARLFVALELPDDNRAGLAAWQRERLATVEWLRPVREDALHATLAFLGYRAERDIDRIAGAAFSGMGEFGPVGAALGGVEPVPRRRPRLYAVGLDDPSGNLAGLQGRLAADIEAAGFYEPERRPFWPHVTVARFRDKGGRQGGGRAGRARPPDDAAAVPQLPAGLRAPFVAVRLTLYRSELRPEGARYEAVAGWRLGLGG